MMCFQSCFLIEGCVGVSASNILAGPSTIPTTRYVDFLRSSTRLNYFSVSNISRCKYLFGSFSGPQTMFGNKKRLYALSGYHSLYECSNVVLVCKKNGYVYKRSAPEKLLPQFDCTTCLEIL